MKICTAFINIGACETISTETGLTGAHEATVSVVTQCVRITSSIACQTLVHVETRETISGESVVTSTGEAALRVAARGV